MERSSIQEAERHNEGVVPRVSVLLTCYNHLPYLGQALQSILAQTFADFEILALDDGSTDGTREYLQTQTDPRLKTIFNEKNLGTYATLNRGIEESTGEFLAILNDDDLWEPEKLVLQVAKMDEADYTLVHTNGTFIDQQGKQLEDPAPLGFPFPKTIEENTLNQLIESNKVCTSAALIRKAALGKSKFDPTFYGMGDWHMWLTLAREHKIGYVDQPLTHYRVHPGNASNANESMLRDDLRIREWIATWLDPKDPAAAQNYAALGHLYSMAGDQPAARKALKEALKLDPARTKTKLRLLTTYLPASVRNKLR